MLSDPDSKIINEFGILNTTLTPDDEPYYGIPYPGCYIVDSDGVIIEKFFEQHMIVRPNADQLLRAATGFKVELDVVEAPENVTVDVQFDGEDLRALIARDLVVTIAVPDGQHLYGEPVPPGMVATSVVIDEIQGLATRSPKLPPTHEHTLAETGETLHIFDGHVQILIPLIYNGRVFAQSIRVTGSVVWQSCDDDVCRLPGRHDFELEIPLELPNIPESLLKSLQS